MNLATVLVNTPVLNWEGLDTIGQRARISGDAERGHEFLYYDEETCAWKRPHDLDEYRRIVEAFLAEMCSSGNDSAHMKRLYELAREDREASISRSSLVAEVDRLRERLKTMAFRFDYMAKELSRYTALRTVQNQMEREIAETNDLLSSQPSLQPSEEVKP